MRKFAQRIKSLIVGSPAAASTTAVHAAAATSGAVTAITTGFTDPDAARNITATAGGTAGDIAAVAVTVTGTNIKDQPITETLPAFTVNTAGTVTGSKAFKTVTAVSVPAMDGAGATVAIGVGSKLGLADCLTRDTALKGFLDGAVETDPPVFTTDADEVEKNVAVLSSTLDGSEVIIDYYVN